MVKNDFFKEAEINLHAIPEIDKKNEKMSLREKNCQKISQNFGAGNTTCAPKRFPTTYKVPEKIFSLQRPGGTL